MKLKKDICYIAHAHTMPGMSVHVNLKNVCNLLHVNLSTYVHEKIIINIYFVQNKCTLRS